MLEPVANIKTLMIEGSGSPVHCCHKVTTERSLCQHLKVSMEDFMIFDPCNLAVSELISDLMAPVEA